MGGSMIQKAAGIAEYETTPNVRITFDAGGKWELPYQYLRPANKIAYEISLMDRR